MNQNPGAARFTRLLVPLAAGLVLGGFLYARFAGTGQHAPAVSARTEIPTGPSGAGDVVQISPESQREVGIAVESAALRRLEGTLSATGTVSEDPGRVVHVRPLARGLIEKVYVRLGDRVSAGDPLAEYDNVELGLAIGEFLNAQAELQQNLTDLEVKKKILERSKAMLREGAISQTTYDLREAEFKNAEAKAAGARAKVARITEQIHRYGWTDYDLANLALKQGASGHSISHSTLKAPFAGVITNYHASVGEVVEPSAELFTITDMSSLWVLADVFEKDLSHIRPGKAVRVRVASYPDREFEGKITNIADAIDLKLRTVKVRCLVRNNSRMLKLDMFATIEIPVEQTGPVLAVPDSALQQIDGRPVVFVRHSASEFQKREVRTGLASRGYTEIKSGLAPGESVAGRGSFVIKTAFLRNLIGED